MQIDLHSPVSLLTTDWNSQQAADKSQISTETGAGDRLSTTKSGPVVKALTAQAMQTAPTRQDKIAQLREAISNGTYKLDPHAIADAMIKNGQ